MPRFRWVLSFTGHGVNSAISWLCRVHRVAGVPCWDLGHDSRQGYGLAGGKVHSASGEPAEVGTTLGQVTANLVDLIEAKRDALGGVGRAGR